MNMSGQKVIWQSETIVVWCIHERTLTRPNNVFYADFWSLAKNPFNNILTRSNSGGLSVAHRPVLKGDEPLELEKTREPFWTLGVASFKSSGLIAVFEGSPVPMLGMKIDRRLSIEFLAAEEGSDGFMSFRIRGHR